MAQQAKAPVLKTDYQTYAVIDGLPEGVTSDKVEKLKTVITKILLTIPAKVRKIDIPVNASGVASRFCFVEFESDQDLKLAVTKCIDKPLAASTKITAYSFKTFMDVMATPPECVVQEEKFDPKETMSWLISEECDDQYVVTYGKNEREDHTAVFLNKREGNSLIKDKEYWTDTKYVAWSPKGSYLASFHPKLGIELWGGPNFTSMGRFKHPGVTAIDFSPDERFLVTFVEPRGSRANSANNNESNDIIIWEIQTPQIRRTFPFTGLKPEWPAVKWSHNADYFALHDLEGSSIRVYASATMQLVDNKVIKVDGLQSLSFSPSDNYLAYWVPEADPKPARVTILSIPQKTELAVKNLFNVQSCQMHWQSKGDFLCVEVERRPKTKKGFLSNFEIFSLREKSIPCDQLEIKDKIIQFSWEPNGQKFAILHGEVKLQVTFYDLTGRKINVLKVLKDDINANEIHWSPRGQICLLAGVNKPEPATSFNGALMFIDTEEVGVLSNASHDGCSMVQWDPTGRYLISSSFTAGHKDDTGFKVWSSIGRAVPPSQSIPFFYQLEWRPRPLSLLKETHFESIKKNRKAYQAKFDAQDKANQNRASADQIAERRRIFAAFQEYRTRRTGDYAKLAKIYQTLRPARVEKELEQVEEYWILEKEEEEPVSRK